MTPKQVIEAALFASGQPLSVATLQALFDDHERPNVADITSILSAIEVQFADCGFHLAHSANGYYLQTKQSLAPWVGRLWEDRAPRLSRAVWETLAVIAWQQPVTRATIEDVRGVTVSSNVMRTLVDYGWVVVVGHKDVPGRPALFGTTDLFLQEFGLTSLEDLPPLVEPSEWQEAEVEDQEVMSFAKLLAKHMEKQQEAPNDDDINQAITAADDVNAEFDALMAAPQAPDEVHDDVQVAEDTTPVLLTDDEQEALIARKLAEQEALLARKREDENDAE
ncbi:SMC-Scp complex subunit ScpB [Salinibius halmophilus]|uniref:SMC-Scp complex subunit ScpB n=1 Tax=Salinibius halmophilus TaxID=1853216 RepID=UPI000E669B53|nr:SMC-Scp complex subunit ScpB [Salinibius halmophilus]